MTEAQRGRRAIEIGPTGRALARNLLIWRKRRDLTTRQLSEQLKEAGRYIPPSGITRMENGERVVTADELVALAAVLGVPPITLLMPESVRGDVEVTGVGPVNGRKVWRWMQGREPLQYPPDAGEEARARILAMWLIHTTPEGVGYDQTTAEGIAAAIKVLKGAFGASESGDADGPGVD